MINSPVIINEISTLLVSHKDHIREINVRLSTYLQDHFNFGFTGYEQIRLVLFNRREINETDTLYQTLG